MTRKDGIEYDNMGSIHPESFFLPLNNVNRVIVYDTVHIPLLVILQCKAALICLHLMTLFHNSFDQPPFKWSIDDWSPFKWSIDDWSPGSGGANLITVVNGRLCRHKGWDHVPTTSPLCRRHVMTYSHDIPDEHPWTGFI